MTTVTGITVEVSNRKIVLKKGEKILFSGYEFWDKGSIPSKVLEILPKGAYAVIRGDTYQPVSKSTADLIKSALEDYRNLPEVRIPREREELREAIRTAYMIWEDARESDYNKDMGLIESVKAEKDIENAEKALKCFDIAHPEYALLVKDEAEKRSESLSQSALNA